MHLKSKIKQCPMVWTALGDTGTKLPTQQKIPTLRYRCSDLPAFCLWTLKVSLTLCPFKYVVSTVTCKGFNTFITIIGLLSTMCLFMYLEMTVIGKGFITFIFFIRFLSRTFSFMYSGMTVFWKGFTSFITFMQFLYSMFLYMRKELWHEMTLPHCNIHEVSLLYVFSYVVADNCNRKRIYSTDYIHRVSFLYLLFLKNSFYNTGDYKAVKGLYTLITFMTFFYHIGYIHKVSLQNVFFCLWRCLPCE